MFQPAKRGERKPYNDDLLANEARDAEEVSVAGHTEEEGDGVKEIPEDEVQGEPRSLDGQVRTKPAKKSINETDESENAEQRSDNAAGNLDTKPGAVGERVNGVGSLVLVIVGDNDAASSESLLGLGVAQLGHGERCRDRHDA